MATTGGPPTTGIVTPEAVLLEFETAGVASRTVAELLDLGVQFGGLSVVLLGAAFVAGALGAEIGGVVLVVVALVAGTLVLRQRAGRRAAPPVSFGVPWNWESYVETLDVSPLTDEQYGVVRAVLLRLGELTPAARWQVSTEVATAVAGQMRIPVPVQVPPDMFLTCVATAYQRRHAR
jgi:hypothetical protein